MKDKLTMPSDTVGRGRGKSVEDKTVTVTVEEYPPGAAADILKDARRTTGRMGEKDQGKAKH